MIVTKKGISANINGALSAVTSISGNPVVKLPPSGGTVEWYNPAYDAAGQRNGNMLNVPGNNGIPISTVNSLATTGRKVMPGDVLIIVKDAANPNLRTVEWPLPGSESRSRVDEAMAISFVAYDPIEGQLTPPIIGRKTNPIVNFLRGTPVPTSLLNIGKLPSKFDLSLLDNDVPSIELLEKVFSDTWGEYHDGWPTDQYTPALQNPGYGRNIAAWVSKGLLYLCSTEPPESKQRLAALMVDQGWSLAGAFADGRINQSNGGHMQGRKALLILAGYLLNIAVMENPNWLGDIFQENHMHRFENGNSWWFDPKWTAMWRKASEWRFPCDKPPAQWTADEKWNMQGYYWPSCGANIGTALAMRAMGLEDAIGKPFMRAIEQYMEGPPEVAKQALVSAGVDVQWGLDWPAPWTGVGFQKKLWEIYGTNVL